MRRGRAVRGFRGDPSRRSRRPSAARGVTDALLDLVAAAERQEDVANRLDAVRNRHVDMVTELCDPHSASEFIHGVDDDCRDIASILHAVRLTRAASGNTRDLVVGFGEIWSTRLFTRYLAGRGRRTEAVGRRAGVVRSRGGRSDEGAGRIAGHMRLCGTRAG